MWTLRFMRNAIPQKISVERVLPILILVTVVFMLISVTPQSESRTLPRMLCEGLFDRIEAGEQLVLCPERITTHDGHMQPYTLKFAFQRREGTGHERFGVDTLNNKFEIQLNRFDVDAHETIRGATLIRLTGDPEPIEHVPIYLCPLADPADVSMGLDCTAIEGYGTNTDPTVVSILIFETRTPNPTPRSWLFAITLVLAAVATTVTLRALMHRR